MANVWKFVMMTIAVLLSLNMTVETNQWLNQCKTSDDCAAWNACIRGYCGNPCEVVSQGGRATCKVSDHRFQLTCADGYEFPAGSGIPVCLDKEWACQGDKENSGVINCNSPSWICLDTRETTQCGPKDTVLRKLIENVSVL